MNPTDLIAGPYKPPTLAKGARTFCLYRDSEVVITSWSDARIPWPRARSIHYKQSAPSLLVNDELARAIRTESAAALKFWFGVGAKVVWQWRKAFDIGQWGTEGSKRLHAQITEKAARATRGTTMPVGEMKRRARVRLAKGFKRGVHPRDWTPAEIKLLDKLSDSEVSRRTGRSASSVRAKRYRSAMVGIC